jgi:RHS repeat-associated protein
VGSTTYWLHTDRLGNIQAITDAAGAIVQRRTYRPYGEKIADTTGHVESRGWIDQRQDETGLTYLHARYYDPQLGTFLSPDPIGPAGGLNSFGYAFGDPANLADPSGHLPKWAEVAIDKALEKILGDVEMGGIPILLPLRVFTTLIRILKFIDGLFGVGPNPAASSQGAGPVGQEVEFAMRPVRARPGPGDAEAPAPAPTGASSPDVPAPGSGDDKGAGDLGGDWKPTRNVGFLVDFLRGGGRPDRDYYRADPQTVDMRSSYGVQRMREDFFSKGCPNQSSFGYDPGTAWWDTLVNPLTADWFGTPAQVGGFTGTVRNNGNGSATLIITNEAGTHSFFYHALPNRSGTTGPLRTIRQTFEWTEGFASGQCK